MHGAYGAGDAVVCRAGQLLGLGPGQVGVGGDGVPLVVENNSKLAGALSGFARTLAGVPKNPEQKKSTKGGGLFGLLGGR